MKRTFILFALALLTFVSCNYTAQSEGDNNKSTITNDTLAFKNGYSEVNGIRMYYETYGQGKPFVLIHGGGSTIQSNFRKVTIKSFKVNILSFNHPLFKFLDVFNFRNTRFNAWCFI